MHPPAGLAEDFTAFPWVNPHAPKGGTLRLAQVGTFDSLNPFIIRGAPAVGLRDRVYESLMARNYDEPFSLYASVASEVVVSEDRSKARFFLNPKARFSDGTPLTSADVLFSWRLLRDRGKPNHRLYYRQVAEAAAPNPHEVAFTFAASADRELPLLIALMPIVPRHVYAADVESFNRTTLDPPIGSGPYKVAEAKAGARIVYQRDPNWWAQDLPVNRGRRNFDRIIHDYYRDASAAWLAFTAGDIDLRPERDPARWQRDYRALPVVRDGRVVLKTFASQAPAGMRAIALNTRRKPLDDIRVRKALAALFDFPSLNATLYASAWARTDSIFAGSALSAAGRPASAEERALLAPFPGAVDAAILENGYRPHTPKLRRNRDGRRRATQLLREAGYTPDGTGALTNAQGNPLRLEILAGTLEEERIALAWRESLASVGIEVAIARPDASQLQARRTTFDYDAIFAFWGASLSPGNEQAFYWSSEAADAQGSRNYAGLKSPAADAMVARLTEARDRQALIDAARALDRVIMSAQLFVPLFHAKEQMTAASATLRAPRATLYGYALDAWWFEN